jgi:GT2 family glycosyltransferase
MVPPLSLVIPTHNRADLLQLCLTSVCAHAPEHTEIIVVDDASPDGAAGRVASQFAGVRVVRLPSRQGFCRAANAGIECATAPVVELLNDDTQVTTGWADAALRRFADPSIGAVAPLVLQGEPGPGTPLIDSAGDRYFIGGIAGKRGHGRPLSEEYLQPSDVFGASASSAFYRREALLRVGAFPAHFGAYFEDVDLSFRLRRAGYRIVYEPASRLWHRGNASHGTIDPTVLAQQSCNEERVFWRNLPAGLLLRALPWHLAVLAAKAWRRWREGTLWPFVLGRLRALAEVRELLKHRRQFGVTSNPEEWSLDRRWWGRIS